MNKALWRLIAVCLALTAVIRAPALAQVCDRSVDVSGEDQLFDFKTSELLSALPPVAQLGLVVQQGFAVAEAYQLGCANFDLWFFSAEDADGSFSFRVDNFVSATGRVPSFSFNHKPLNLVPTVRPCEGPPSVTEQVHSSGGAGVTAVHFGTGPYPKKFREITFHTCDNIVIETSSPVTFEVPIRVTGGVTAAESFGDANEGERRVTRGYAKLSLSGSIGGNLFEEKAEVELQVAHCIQTYIPS